MWMTDYIRAVKRGLRDKHGCKQIGGTKDDPLIKAPDGEYPIKIKGKLDRVVVKDGKINCCNFN
jgi:hypothetical protein